MMKRGTQQSFQSLLTARVLAVAELVVLVSLNSQMGLQFPEFVTALLFFHLPWNPFTNA